MCKLSRTCDLLSSETLAGGASSETSRQTSVGCNSIASDVASRERSVREPGDIQPSNKGPDADHVSAPSCSDTLWLWGRTKCLPQQRGHPSCCLSPVCLQQSPSDALAVFLEEVKRKQAEMSTWPPAGLQNAGRATRIWAAFLYFCCKFIKTAAIKHLRLCVGGKNKCNR